MLLFAKKNPSPKLIISLVFCLALAEAVTSYYQSTYLLTYFSLVQIGLITALATIITLILTSLHPKLITKHGNYHSALISCFAIWLSHIIFTFTNLPVLIIASFIVRYASLALLFLNLDLALESVSKDSDTGKIRAGYLTFFNLAWLISPLMSSRAIEGGHYQRMYGISLIAITVFLFILLYFRKQLDQKLPADNREIKWLQALAMMLKKPNVLRVFISALLLQMFFCLAILYIPIHLVKGMGISNEQMGWILTLMLVPFVLIQYPAGLIADKFFGEKEMLIIGQTILAVSAICVFLATSHSAWFWAWLLFTSRIGAALAESMQEIYFYKQVNVSDIGLINLFRQTRRI